MRPRRAARGATAPLAAVVAAVLVGGAGRAQPSDAACPDGLPPAAAAEALLGDATPPDAPSDVLDRARDLVRRALLEEKTPLFLLRAADLADMAGDAEESVRALEEAARLAPELLSPSERLALARQEEARGARKRAIHEYAAALTALARRGEPFPAWIGERIRRLDLEEEAGSLRLLAYRPPTAEARAAFLDAKARQEEGKADAARAGFRRALRLSPGYVEAALALGSLEMRAARVPEAVAAYRTALAADPERFEALLSLANALWSEPDRQAKEESLALLDRAAALRTDLPSLLKESARRWASWGDAARALERVRAYDALVPDDHELDALRERLTQSARHAETLQPTLPDLDSPALGPYRLAQAYARRGDDASRKAALELLAEAESADARFAGAWELEATLREQEGDTAKAEAALRRALDADPTRAATHERLALLLARSGREAEAEVAWQAAERAGSREALHALAVLAERAGKSARARSLHERYLAAAPDGPHAEEARRALAKSDRTRTLARDAGLAAGVLALGAAALLLRRRSGATVAEWLKKDPAAARELRGPVGRLRHEVWKHGGLFLGDAAQRLKSGPPAPATAHDVPATARLLLARLFGGDAGAAERGIVPEAERALTEIAALARTRGVRVNLTHRDPLLAPVHRAAALLRRARAPLSALAEGRDTPARRARAASRLEAALELLDARRGATLGALLDAASSTPVDLAELSAFLAEAARARGVEAPPLETLGAWSAAPRVRVEHVAWATIWRNLFTNALEAGASRRLALSAGESRDAVTGLRIVRVALADDAARPLTTEMIQGRAAERGLGVVADLVRLHEGVVFVGPPPAAGYTKSIVLELPALEEPA